MWRILTASWIRWDEFTGGSGVVETSTDDITGDGLPVGTKWREEVSSDSYLVFYDLLPVEGNERGK